MAEEADREGREPGAGSDDAGGAGEERAAPPEEPAPPKRRKKKKRRADTEAQGGRQIPADWPPFARAYPADPALDRLVDAFERGDYAAVRAGAPVLAKTADSDDVRRAAADLRRRVDPDPLAVGLLLAAAALLVFLSAWYWSHAHAP